MQKYSALKSTAFACLMMATAILQSPASASSTDTDRVLAMVTALEARVTALENENRQYKRDANEARTQARIANQKLLQLTNASASMPVKTLPIRVREDTSLNWTGLYWGVTAGGAITRSQVVQTEQYVSNIPANPPPANINGINMAATSGPSHGAGGVVDIFGGWNYQFANTLLIGAQLEATVGDLGFSSAGTRSYSYFDANGPTGQTAVGDFRPQVTSQWMATALLRAGVLLTERTLLYGVGGWTIAEFEARNLADNSFYQLPERFFAGGWTAGAGIERKLDTNWSLRAEYRYTNFGSHGTQDQFQFQSSGAFSGTQSYQHQTQFEQSMQVGRVGVVYAFNPFK